MPPETFYAIVGSNISRFRQGKKITQEKLARAISLDRTSVSNIEQGRQKILLHSLYEIASALEVNPVDLLPSENTFGVASTSEFSVPENISVNEKLWISTLMRKAEDE